MLHVGLPRALYIRLQFITIDTSPQACKDCRYYATSEDRYFSISSEGSRMWNVYFGVATELQIFRVIASTTYYSDLSERMTIL